MNTKRLLLMMLAVISISVSAQIGSMRGAGLPLYPIRDGSAPGTALAGVSFAYKIVTVGQKTYAWTSMTGRNIAGNSWSSQLRFWQPAKLENNLLGRVSGTQQTYGSCNNPTLNPLTITFLQEENNNFFETADITYDYTLANSADVGDTQAPALADPVVVNQNASGIQLSLSATDDSGYFFYVIEDAANNFVTVSFFDNPTIALTAGVDYNLTVKAVDFSGNESAPKNISAQVVEYECDNNLIEGVNMSVGTVYFAPNWAVSTNYTAAYSNGTFTLHLGDATWGDWQAQFPLMLASAIAIDPAKTFGISMDVTSNNNIMFYVKIQDTNDNAFIDIPRAAFAAGTGSVSSMTVTAVGGITQISKILFDFGGNPANTDITISNIKICDQLKEVTTAVDNVTANTITVYPNPANDMVKIAGLAKEAVVTVSDLTGKTVLRTVTNGDLNISTLVNGLYLLNVENQVIKLVKK
ncbi:MAG: T9SS type A sorting domain-containing protein [Paludibacter sp.]|nr:T9SS type A sorting domain-containing protein [Paludibacter sp.]